MKTIKFIPHSEVAQYLAELGSSDQEASGPLLVVESSDDVGVPVGFDRFLRDVKRGVKGGPLEKGLKYVNPEDEGKLAFSTHRTSVENVEEIEEYLLNIPGVPTCDPRITEGTCRVRIITYTSKDPRPDITYPEAPIRAIVSYIYQNLSYEALFVRGDLITILVGV